MRKGVKRTHTLTSDSTAVQSSPNKQHAVMKVKRKKAKTCKSSATEVLSGNPHSSSTEKNDKLKSDKLQKENENDLTLSQCQPLLLSQSGKFIPKFMAKKKIGDCVVKIECASRLVHAEPDKYNVPVLGADTGLESKSFSAISVADKTKDVDAYADNVAMTETHNDNNQPAFAECVAGLEASKLFIGSNKQGVLADISSQVEGTKLDSSRPNDIDYQGCTSVEEKVNSVQNGGVSGDIQQCINSETTDQYNVDNATKSAVSSSASDNITSGAESAPVVHEDCTQLEALEIVSHENNQCPVAEHEATEDNKECSADDTGRATVPLEADAEDTSDHISSEAAVNKIVSDGPVSLAVPDDTEPYRDVMASNDDSGGKAAMNDSYEDNGSSKALGATVSELDNSTVIGNDMRDSSKTAVDRCDPVTVDSAPAEDREAVTGDAVALINTVSEASVSDTKEQIMTGLSEHALFDDFLDLTDSQLCQLDDVSSDSSVHAASKVASDLQMYKRTEGRTLINRLIAQLNSIKQEIASVKQRHLQHSRR